MSTFPLPGAEGVVAVPAPAPGPQNWAGAPTAALEEDGSFVVAYRVRWSGPQDANVIARSPDGEHFETVATLDKERFGTAMVERPALVRTDSGRWRLYICCATPSSKHWWIGVLEADSPEALADVDARPVFSGDETVGVKDPVIRRGADGRWHGWICCHPLDVAGEEDRMSTGYATSADGLDWDWHGTVLSGRPGSWDARGARLTAVLPDGRAAYDGRASKEENWFERTGLAGAQDNAGRFVALRDEPVSPARYLDVLPLDGGYYRIYYEHLLPDESHELRTELVAPAAR